MRMFIHHEYLQLKTILSALIQHSFYISHFLQNQKIKNKILKKNNNNSVLWKKNGSSANPDKSIWQCDRTTNVDYQCAFLFMMLVPSLNCVRILLFFFFKRTAAIVSCPGFPGLLHFICKISNGINATNSH